MKLCRQRICVGSALRNKAMEQLGHARQRIRNELMNRVKQWIRNDANFNAKDENCGEESGNGNERI